MWAFGKAAAVGFEVAMGEFAPGGVVSAGKLGTADRSSAGQGETDGCVNLAASGALEPCAFVVVVQQAAGWKGYPHLCNEEGLPQASWLELALPGGSVGPLETNLLEPPVRNIMKE